MIDRTTIERIMSAADIVEVVSEFVTLRKAGTNWKGLCPFHNEKTPSFMVSPSKGICKCFSCGKGGNVAHFLMLHEQMTYPEALRWLAKKYHIEIQERELTAEDIRQNNLRDSLLIVNKWACDVFQNNLFNTTEGESIGLGYFRNRGLRDDTIRTFSLGYALQARTALADQAAKQGYNPDFLIETGLCLKTDEGVLKDKCRGRVIFPIQALDGKVIAFGARTLSSDKKVAKYINSPESLIYHKSDVLYGIYQAKASIQKEDCCFLVEGYMDVISMHQSGIKNVVASSGTSLTYGQIRLIHRFTSNLTVLYDGDMAGIKASLRGINMLLEEGMNIRVLLLPDGDDPDSFSRKYSPEEFRAYIQQHQVDFIRFKVNILMQDIENDPLKKSSVTRSIIESIAVIPDALTRSTYLKECSNLLDVSEATLVNETTKQRYAFIEQRKEEQRRKQQGNDINQPAEPLTSTPQPENPLNSPTPPTLEPHLSQPQDAVSQCEALIIKVIIRYGECNMAFEELEDGTQKPIKIIEYITDELEADQIEFKNPIYRKILEEAKLHLSDPGFKASDYFMIHPNQQINLIAAQMISDRYQISENFAKERNFSAEIDKLNAIVPLLLIDLKLAIVTQQMKSILKSLQDPALINNTELYTQQMMEYQRLKDIQKMLTSLGGDRTITT